MSNWLRNKKRLLLIPFILLVFALIPILTLGATWVRSVGLLPSSAVVFASDAPAVDRMMATVFKGMYGDRVQIVSGAADDEIQAAIDALPKGSTIKLSIGEFDIQTTLSFAGRFATTLEGQAVASGIANNYAQAKYGTVLTVDTSLTGPVISLTQTSSLCTLKNFRIQIDTTKQVSGDGILNNSAGLTLDHIWIEGAKENGFHNQDLGTINSHGRAQDLTCSNNTLNGVYVSGGNDWTFDELDTFGNGLHGVQISAGARIDILHFNSFLNGRHGILIDTGVTSNRYGWTMRDGSCNDNQYAGISVAGDISDATLMRNVIIDNVTFFNNSMDGDLNYDNIQFWNYLDQILVSNCSFIPYTYTHVGWQINFPGHARNVLVTHNNLAGGTRWGWTISHDANSTITFKDNIGYISPGEIRTASVTFTGGAQNAILCSWHNPEAQDIYIMKVGGNVSALDADAANIDWGIADSATYTNGGTEFFNDLAGETVKLNDSWLAGDGGAQTKWVLCQDSASATDGWVVAKILDADGTSIAGTGIIQYCGA